ncbi:MAG: GNAT family N-acetyltransferase [Flavobacterium sp.]|nr:GNAT family N-acetyltransferase [Pedobacter sp.]
MIIREATITDLDTIHRIAHQTWWPTYTGVISNEQIEFMLEDMYSVNALLSQIKNAIFLIAERDKIPVAFAAYSLKEPENMVFKLQKLYVLPSEQGKGTGKKLIEKVIDLAKQRNGKVLELNVNRGNPAFDFYKQLGFEVYQEVNIPYYRFILNDFVMRKPL